MLYLRSWLEDYIDLEGVSNSELANLISLYSGEVDEITKVDDYFNNLAVVGQIHNLRKHPKADNLQIFDLQISPSGQALKTVQIVSAATNIYEGMLCPVALPGCQLAEFKIAERALRGETSFGMCLGKSELMLETEDSPRIWDLGLEFRNLNKKPILGQSICQAFPEYFPAETIIEIKYLPDKYTSFGSHLGLAVELSTIFKDRSLLKGIASKLFKPDDFWQEFLSEAKKITQSNLSLNFADETDYTQHFFLFKADLNSENKFFVPHQIRRRLFLTGRNQTGSVADLSNYLTFDVGQPSHFFSYQKLLEIDQEITNTRSLNWRVTEANEGVSFSGLGQLKDVKLTSQVRVLNSKSATLATPAISGGSNTSVSKEDTEILIEVASFKPDEVAKVCSVLNYRSDAARYWVGGVEPSWIVIWLFQFLSIAASSHLNLNFVGFWSEDKNFKNWLSSLENLFNLTRQIKIDEAKLFSRIGPDYQTKSTEILKLVNFLGHYQNSYFTPNQFYHPIYIPEDLLFDVSRLLGLSQLKSSYLTFPVKQADHYWVKKDYFLRQAVASFGFQEIYSRPFLASNYSQFAENSETASPIEALNSVRENEPFLRDRFLWSLLASANKNLLKGYKEFGLFELNKVYQKPGSELLENFLLEALAVDFPVTKLTSLWKFLCNSFGDEYLEISQIKTKVGKGYRYLTSAGLTAEILQVSNKVKKEFELPLNKNLTLLSANLTNWSGLWNSNSHFQPESDFPEIKRSYSWLISQEFNWAEMELIVSNSKFIFSDQSVEILVTPVERLSYSLESVILNFKVKFSSHSNNLQSTEISAWETFVIESLGQYYTVQPR